MEEINIDKIKNLDLSNFKGEKIILKLKNDSSSIKDEKTNSTRETIVNPKIKNLDLSNFEGKKIILKNEKE